jgi:hypothetical protein
MADVRIGSLNTQVEVTDTDALLNPRVMAQIVAAVEAAMAEKAVREAARKSETRIGREGQA